MEANSVINKGIEFCWKQTESMKYPCYLNLGHDGECVSPDEEINAYQEFFKEYPYAK